MRLCRFTSVNNGAADDEDAYRCDSRLCLVLAACGSSANRRRSSQCDGQRSRFEPTAVHRRAESRPSKSPWAMAFLPGSRTAIVTEKPGTDLAGRRAQRPQAAGRRRPEVVISEPGRASRRRTVADLRERSAGLSHLFRAFGERRQRPRARPREAGPERPAARGSKACSVFWHDPAGGEGGQFGAIIAFAPDGKSLFLSSASGSASRRRRTRASRSARSCT